MKLAFTTLACPDWTVERCVEAAQSYGYAGLELRLLDGRIIGAEISSEQRRRVRSCAAQAGLAIVGLDTSVRVAQIDAARRAEEIREGLALLELAHDLEAPFIRVFSGPPSDCDEEEAIDGAVSTLAPLARRGHELGVAVALETHDAFARSSLVAEVLGRMSDRSVGALWDFLHPYRMEEQAQETARHLQGHIRHVHVKDGRHLGPGQSDWALTLLGEGEVPTVEMLYALYASGYDGWLSVEWEKYWHPELPGPETALPQHVAKIHEYLATLAMLPPMEHTDAGDLSS